jgi:hypothetical protein
MGISRFPGNEIQISRPVSRSNQREITGWEIRLFSHVQTPYFVRVRLLSALSPVAIRVGIKSLYTIAYTTRYDVRTISHPVISRSQGLRWPFPVSHPGPPKKNREQSLVQQVPCSVFRVYNI